MGRVRRARMSSGEEAEVWTRWQRGESCVVIGRALDRDRGAIFTVVARRGGIPPPPRRRSRLALCETEREEISRGLARGESLRQIGRRVGRAASTVSREVRRHGGRRHYRAATADTQAVGPRPAAEVVTACGLRRPAPTGGDRRSGLVPAADRGVAHPDLSGRSLSPRVARDDLPESVCAEPGGAEKGADGPPAPAAPGPPGASGDAGPTSHPRHRRRGLHPRAAGGGG